MSEIAQTRLRRTAETANSNPARIPQARMLGAAQRRLAKVGSSRKTRRDSETKSIVCVDRNVKAGFGGRLGFVGRQMLLFGGKWEVVEMVWWLVGW